MNRILKIFLGVVFSLWVFSIFQSVEANSIGEITMDIYIDNNGNASVVETWNCTTNSGTEVYHPYYNLGKSKIENLTVSDKGKTYKTLSSWDTQGSLSDKAYKCGINTVSDGVELCWGISSYGTHSYKVSYTISNFIAELKDSQMLYWTLIPYDFSNSIGNVNIKVYTESELVDSVEAWGYGFEGGKITVYDEYIEMQSNNRLSTSEYVTLLVKFPSGTFSTSNYINQNFNYYYEMAEEGTTNSILIGENIKDKLLVLFVVFLVIILRYGFGFISSWISFIIRIIIEFIMLRPNKIRFGKVRKKILFDLDYYRDIPCEKNIFRAYFIAYTYGIIRNKTDLLGAIILKWIKESIVRIEKKGEKGFFKREKILIYLNEVNSCNIVHPEEEYLFKMIYEASKDGILESKEFERWCRKNYKKLLEWFDLILKLQKEILVQEGLISVEEKTFLKIFKLKSYTVTITLKEEALQLAGLKKYLKEYTLIKNREPIEVILFEDYLVYAQMLGIAKKVSKDFEEVYPEIIEQSNFASCGDIIAVTTYSAHLSYVVKSAAYSSSSGTRGGGGRGSFGGGRGGGGFR